MELPNTDGLKWTNSIPSKPVWGVAEVRAFFNSDPDLTTLVLCWRNQATTLPAFRLLQKRIFN